MERCVYCGRILDENAIKAKAHTRDFAVCNPHCKEEMQTYIAKDKKYKLPMYLMIFVGGVGFLISALIGAGKLAMVGAYMGQVIAGFAFLFFPYPILSFETFFSISIKKVKLVCRILGIIFVVFGFVLIYQVVS